LTGAFLGGNLGRLLAGVPSEPTGIPEGGLEYEEVSVGDYVAINANVAPILKTTTRQWRGGLNAPLCTAAPLLAKVPAVDTHFISKIQKNT
jgi:hypothetical protein